MYNLYLLIHKHLDRATKISIQLYYINNLENETSLSAMPVSFVQLISRSLVFSLRSLFSARTANEFTELIYLNEYDDDAVIERNHVLNHVSRKLVGSLFLCVYFNTNTQKANEHAHFAVMYKRATKKPKRSDEKTNETLHTKQQQQKREETE